MFRVGDKVVLIKEYEGMGDNVSIGTVGKLLKDKDGDSEFLVVFNEEEIYVDEEDISFVIGQRVSHGGHLATVTERAGANVVISYDVGGICHVPANHKYLKTIDSAIAAVANDSPPSLIDGVNKDFSRALLYADMGNLTKDDPMRIKAEKDYREMEALSLSAEMSGKLRKDNLNKESKMEKAKTEAEKKAVKQGVQESIDIIVDMKRAEARNEMNKFIEIERLAREYRKKADGLRDVLGVTADQMKQLFD